ncbi:hypothetical protein OG585_27385 [Streptomyces sp. NBC_01340]|uniref:hypothetical protein n=1 Tax=unclassified Streptomyces TaxID=2593676 RepID=UPI00225AFF53|nr:MULTISPECIES: hypothetical protein [unclassified Streptomyces]MCX4456316.1 hypothetical protein [Streptomyces sp. NBC_01719]MCX4495674.1 hypothetical protein [Streptomyces sp. NBC_01728]MCX4589743.1 hypothetical protein [Streptomyces sp. NBC_01549]WSI40617.1 hypothetical protein OG585_27385 [Streptomyces sp. NBC_01340]
MYYITGLMGFGLMIGADRSCLRDEDYRFLRKRAVGVTSRLVQRLRPAGTVGAEPARISAFAVLAPRDGAADA